MESLRPPEKQLIEEETQVFNLCILLLIEFYTRVLLHNVPRASLIAQPPPTKIRHTK